MNIMNFMNVAWSLCPALLINLFLLRSLEEASENKGFISIRGLSEGRSWIPKEVHKVHEVHSRLSAAVEGVICEDHYDTSSSNRRKVELTCNSTE
jgi:hypothetical protein